MSDKIKSKVQKTPPKNGEKTFTLTPQAIVYMKNLQVIQQNMDMLLNQASAAYLKTVSIDFGYKFEDDIKFKLDVNDPARQITFIDVPKE